MSGGFRNIFESDACEAEFLQVSQHASRVEDIHDWMLSNRSCLHEWAHFSWLAPFRNDEKTIQLSLYHQLYMVKTRLMDGQSCTGDGCLLKEVTTELQKGLTTEVDADSVATTNAFLDKVETNTAFKAQMDKAYDAVKPMCAYHANLECVPALKLALDWMYPRSFRLDVTPKEYFTVSMIPFYRKFFADTKSQKYASRFALTLLDAVAKRMTLLPESFYQMGLKSFEGDQERFWQFIVVYATRGAAWATAYPMVGPGNKYSFMALMVVSSAMSYFDFYHGQHQEGWSYGTIATNSCYQPKPYHYWMAAAFAHLLAEAGYTSTTAKLVGRLTGAMYEIGSTTVGRHPDLLYFAPPYSVGPNTSRRDITHHYLGTEFGAWPSESSFISFDQELGQFMSASRPLPTMSDDEMRERIKDPLTRWRYWTRLTGFYRFPTETE
jgi:hypothetical protein